MVWLVQLLMEHPVLVSAALLGLVQNPIWIPRQTLVTVAYHKHSNINVPSVKEKTQEQQSVQLVYT